MADLPTLAALTQYPPAYDGPLGTQLANVLSEVASERWRQDQRWGGPAHDDAHSYEEWQDFIDHQVAAANLEILNETDAEAAQMWRRRMVKIAALAIAAVQSSDRRRATVEAAHG